MEKAKLGFVRFFTGLFKYLPKLLLLNILFAIPASAFIALFAFINRASGINLLIIDLVPIIFCMPFWAGVTLVTRNITREDKEIPVIKLFFKGVKDNFLRFLVHGIAFYIALCLCTVSLTLYWQSAKIQNFYYIPFGVGVLFTIALLFISYSIPPMTVTFDLKMRQIYKNSLLMSFGEIKNNFFATIGLFLLTLVVLSVYLAIPSLLIRNIVFIVMFALFVPSVASYIINFYVYKDMARMVTEDKADSAGVKDNSAQRKEETVYDFSQLDLGEDKDAEEYLFFDGRMIKRKTLRSMRDAQEAKEKNEQKEVKKG